MLCHKIYSHHRHTPVGGIDIIKELLLQDLAKMSQSLGVFLKKKELQTAFILDDFINCIYCLQTTSDVLL